MLKQVAEHHQDMTELVEKESVLVKEIAEVITYKYLLIQNFKLPTVSTCLSSSYCNSPCCLLCKR